MWALNGLLLVALTEEALFGGNAQEALSCRFAEYRHSDPFSVGIAAALFGGVHVMGGLAYVLVTGLAEVRYGLAYRKGGLEGEVLAHSTVSVLHLTLFTHPMLAT